MKALLPPHDDGLPMGQNANYVHVEQSLLEQASFTLGDIPK